MAKFEISGPLLRDPLAFAALHKSALEYGMDHPDAEVMVVVMDRGNGLEIEVRCKDDYHDDMYEVILEDMMDAGFFKGVIYSPHSFLVPIWTHEVRGKYLHS